MRWLLGIQMTPLDHEVRRVAEARDRWAAAEGVETAPQLERLLGLGCEEWQGHYFSAPLDGARFEALLSESLSARTARSSEA